MISVILFSLLLVNLNSSLVAKYEPNLCKMKLYATFIIHIFNAKSVRYEYRSNTLVRTPAPDPEIPRICVDCLKFWISVRNKTRTKSVVINCELRAIHKINSYSFAFIVNQRIYLNITTLFFIVRIRFSTHLSLSKNQKSWLFIFNQTTWKYRLEKKELPKVELRKGKNTLKNKYCFYTNFESTQKRQKLLSSVFCSIFYSF